MSKDKTQDAIQDRQGENSPPTENEPQTNEQANEQASRPRMTLLTQYMRDLSFENPGAPQLSTNNPGINVTANVGANKLNDTDYEVGLKFRLEAKSEETIHFIVDFEYCGLFRLENVPEQEIQPVLLIEGPRLLFPFVRRIIADTARDGGYPSILLDPMDFAAIYRNNLQNRQQEAAQNPKSE